MSASPRQPPPKPWSMKWIVLAIVVFVAGYTVVNFYFRKPGRPHQPYQESQERAASARLAAAGWQKIDTRTRRPVEAPSVAGTAATIRRELAGLGPDLESKFAEKPRLVSTIDRVSAPAAVEHGEDCTLYLTLTHSNLKQQLGDLALYRRGQELLLIPTLETLPGKDLMSRWNDSSYVVTFPTANLARGQYTMRIVAMGPAATWTFDVR